MAHRRSQHRAVVVPVMVACSLVLGACVDSTKNAQLFCARVEPLTRDSAAGGQRALPALRLEQKQVERSMRNAEDATRAVREAARDLVKAYDDLVTAIKDGKHPADMADGRRDLEEGLMRVRGACAQAIPRPAGTG